MKPWLYFICIFSWLWGNAQEPVHFNYRSSNGLPSNEVYKVQADNQGYLWFGTDRGVSRFDGSRFSNYSVNDGIGANVVNDIVIAPNGDIWVIADAKKLYHFKDNGFEPYPYNHIIEKAANGSQTPLLAKFAFENNRPAWFSLRSLGLLHIDAAGVASLDTATERINHLEIKPELQITAFYSPRWHNQLLKLKNEPKYFTLQGKKHPMLGSDAMNYLVRKNGTHLVSMGYQLLEFTNNRLSNSYTFKNFITSLFEDTKGQLWVTSYGTGARMYPPQSFPHANNESVFFNNARISSVSQDREGGYWFCSYEKGVFYVPRLDVVTLETKQLRIDELFQDMVLSSDLLYAATSQNRIFKMTMPGNLEPIFSDPAQITTDNCNDLVYDSAHQRLYACFSRGLYIIDLKTNKADHYTLSSRTVLLRPDGFYQLGPSGLNTNIKAEQPIILPSVCFSAMGLPNGQILIGTEAGLYTINNNKATPAYSTAINKRVTSIKQLANGWVVLATLGKGLLLLKDGQTVEVTLGSGNPVNMVNDIAADGNIVWAATEAGIAKADLSNPQQPLVDIIQADTRFPYNNTRKIAFYKGQLVVLAQNKLILLPTNESIVSVKPPVWLHQIIVNDSLRLLPQEPHSFSFSSNRLKFLFNGICFTCGNNIRFRYRLLGLHSEWYNTGQPYVEYPSLSPGTYTFEVVALDGNNIASAQPASYQFTIPSPFWQKNWFRALALLLALALMAILIAYLLKRSQQRNREKELLLAKEQVALSAQINPHFIFNSLNSIQHLIIQEDRQNAVLHMAQFSRLMRLSLDNYRKKWVPVKNEIELLELYLQLESLRFKDKFVYHLQIDEALPLSNLRIPAMLMQPFVENAVHHGINNMAGSNGLITVSLQQTGNTLVASIEDNGIGREKAAQLKDTQKEHLSAGMQITQERLQLLCKETNTLYLFSITDKKDAAGNPCGTLVKFNMPFIQATNNNEIVS